MMENITYIKAYDVPSLDRREIFRYMGVTTPTEQLEAMLDECLLEVLHKLTYKVVYREFPMSTLGSLIDLGFARISSSDLAKCLAGCNKILLFAATIGIELDRMLMRYSRVSPTRALMFQAIGTERIEALCDAFSLDTKARMAECDATVSPRFSPGYGDLDLGLQRDIFAVLDCARIGLTLNDSMLMSPTKSVTAIIGINEGR